MIFLPSSISNFCFHICENFLQTFAILVHKEATFIRESGLLRCERRRFSSRFLSCFFHMAFAGKEKRLPEEKEKSKFMKAVYSTLSYNVKSPSSDPRQFLVTLNVYSKVLLHFYSVQQWQPSQRQCLYTCITYITLVHVLVLNVLSQSFSKLADLRFSKRWRALEDPLDESLFWSFLAKSKNQGFSAYLSLIN